jgi:hypothetical protein
MFGFKRKKRFDPVVRDKLLTILRELLLLQKTVAGKSIEIGAGVINRQVLGYMLGFIDSALKIVGQGATDRDLGTPFVYDVIQRIFPGIEGHCLQCLTDLLGTDRELTEAAVTGNNGYLGYINAKNRGEDPKVPWGVGTELIKGATG